MSLKMNEGQEGVKGACPFYASAARTLQGGYEGGAAPPPSFLFLLILLLWLTVLVWAFGDDGDFLEVVKWRR